MSSFLSEKAFQYSLNELLRRCGFSGESEAESQWLALLSAIHYAHPGENNNEEAGIWVIPCRQSSFDALSLDPSLRLHWAEPASFFPPHYPAPFPEAVPVLLWGDGYEDGSRPFVERTSDGRIIFYADIIAVSVFMLTRHEETHNQKLDEHGRFMAARSAAYRHGFLDMPIVDLYALILKAWLQTLFPTLQPRPPSFSLGLSHDIDSLRRLPAPTVSAKACASSLLKSRDPRLAADNLKLTLASLFDWTEYPYLRGIERLAGVASMLGLRSTLNFMATQASQYDEGYSIDCAAMRKCINRLVQQGHEIGFHPSYDAFDDGEKFDEEKRRLNSVLTDIVGQRCRGGRQHFLHFSVPDTWHQWSSAGLRYDSTLGYPDHEGFRCGTCHPFRPFDLWRDCEIDLLEVPLVVMDVTLRHYRRLRPAQAGETMRTLARRCQQVGGTFTLLWHNTSLEGNWEKWFAMYCLLLRELAPHQGETDSFAAQKREAE